MTDFHATNSAVRTAVDDAAETLEDTAEVIGGEARKAARHARAGAVAATGALADAAGAFARDARSTLRDKAGRARAEADRQYGRLKVEAQHRAEQADVFVHERPYAALAAAALAGFLIGHLMSASRSPVVYLRDDR